MSYIKRNIQSKCNATVFKQAISARKMSLLHDGLPLTLFQLSKADKNGILPGTRGESTAASSNDIKVTLKDLKLQLATEMGVNHPYKPFSHDRAHLAKYLPKSPDALPKRSMQDSYIAAIIPLSTNLSLQEKYTTFLGSVRLGRLMEDMDIFSVIVARKHIVLPDVPAGIFPQTLVTVLVDRVEFTEYAPKMNQDIKISGHVSWVSKSTLEVVVWLEQIDGGKWQRITRAVFLLAARDPVNPKASFVNQFEPANEREKTILVGGEERKKHRMELGSSHLSKKPPNQEEQQILHDLYVSTTDPKDISMSKRVLPTNSVWMNITKVSNAILAQPENRNMHNAVFGGFMMRQAIELAWITGYMHCKFRPRTRVLSDVQFKQPVAVNSLIQMHATLVYTQKQFMQIIVFAQVYNPLSGLTSTTNAFYLTLEAPETVPSVTPQSYYESMLFIDGKRHFVTGLKETEAQQGHKNIRPRELGKQIHPGSGRLAGAIRRRQMATNDQSALLNGRERQL
ncbi:acyl-coenzyme A thioesterase 9, mitochondrial-like isoform X2 [Anthonomus grandis grandis]|uniref:acyl-coenzyme A thioesterase 9, mitochondrial-like isoform X2 n=1 Tax=Anthonomus grandis grandis TaxID=2921223 RepID=UPI00216521BF|nr:acyl-coenzyme A thioesterase 9, mitochondrial-like isoform X2 [Anthonomus grandis grandis]